MRPTSLIIRRTPAERFRILSVPLAAGPGFRRRNDPRLRFPCRTRRTPSTTSVRVPQLQRRPSPSPSPPEETTRFFRRRRSRLALPLARFAASSSSRSSTPRAMSAEEKKDKVVLARARRAIQRQVRFRDTPWPEESFIMWLEEAACVTERRKRLLKLLSVLGRECATFPSEEGILTGISHLNRAHHDAPFDVAHALSTHKLHYLPGRAGQEAQRHQFR